MGLAIWIDPLLKLTIICTKLHLCSDLAIKNTFHTDHLFLQWFYFKNFIVYYYTAWIRTIKTNSALKTIYCEGGLIRKNKIALYLHTTWIRTNTPVSWLTTSLFIHEATITPGYYLLASLEWTAFPTIWKYSPQTTLAFF